MIPARSGATVGPLLLKFLSFRDGEREAGPAAPPADHATSQAFVTLISFLATNVYHALGIDPMTGKALSRRDTAAAQQMIEWLAVLEQKTRGNLNFEETDLLSRALYELRMAYVEAVRPPGREPPRSGG